MNRSRSSILLANLVNFFGLGTLFLAQLALPGLNTIPAIVLFGPLLAIGVVLTRHNVSWLPDGLAVLGLLMVIGLWGHAGANKSGLSSLVYLLFLYALYFSKLSEFGDGITKLRVLQNGLLVIAILAIGQGLVQYAGFGYFDLESLLPNQFVIDGYNFHYPITIDSAMEKSNGFFCLEPSFLSQLMALAILFELETYRRNVRMGFYCGALILSFSGTGILMLACALLVALFRRDAVGARRALFISSVIIVSALIFQPQLLAYFVARASELARPETSGFVRFVAPYVNMYFWATSANYSEILFGRGPGAVQDIEALFGANYPVIPKLIVEYGLIAAVLFSATIMRRIKARFPIHIAVALWVFYFLASGALLQPFTIWILFFTRQLGYDWKRVVYSIRSVKAERTVRKHALMT